MTYVRYVPCISALQVIQFSILLEHSSQATRWRQGRNKVSTLVCLHFLQVISERSRSFSFISFALSITLRDSPSGATVSVVAAAVASAAVVGKLLLVVFVSETKPPVLSLRRTADDAADATDAIPFSISRILNGQFERLSLIHI